LWQIGVMVETLEGNIKKADIVAYFAQLLMHFLAKLYNSILIAFL
jgi:hypothetical protein